VKVKKELNKIEQNISQSKLRKRDAALFSVANVGKGNEGEGEEKINPALGRWCR